MGGQHIEVQKANPPASLGNAEEKSRTCLSGLIFQRPVDLLKDRLDERGSQLGRSVGQPLCQHESGPVCLPHLHHQQAAAKFLVSRKAWEWQE